MKEDIDKVQWVHSLIWVVCGFMVTSILFRFTLLLFGANPQVGFTKFVYTVSTPLVAPFLALFHQVPSYGTSTFEFSDLVAAASYLLLATGFGQLISRLVSAKGPVAESYG